MERLQASIVLKTGDHDEKIQYLATRSWKSTRKWTQKYTELVSDGQRAHYVEPFVHFCVIHVLFVFFLFKIQQILSPECEKIADPKKIVTCRRVIYHS